MSEWDKMALKLLTALQKRHISPQQRLKIVQTFGKRKGSSNVHILEEALSILETTKDNEEAVKKILAL